MSFPPEFVTILRTAADQRGTYLATRMEGPLSEVIETQASMISDPRILVSLSDAMQRSAYEGKTDVSDYRLDFRF